MQGDSWGPGQHTGPLNEKNDQLSPALLKSHLHPVTSHYGCGPAPELQDVTEPACWPNSYQPDRAHRSSGQLILLCQGFSASLHLFSLPSNFITTFAVFLVEQVIIKVPETPLLFFYTITVPYVHLKASTERIRPAKCWALNKLFSLGRGVWRGEKEKEGTKVKREKVSRFSSSLKTELL